MNNRHLKFWPRMLPTTLTVPETTIHDNLTVTAHRFPYKAAIDFYGAKLSYRQLSDEVDALAGYLQTKLGVTKGARVLLYMQNSPQFIISFYAILSIDAVVVPLNPMNLADELRFYIEDCQTKLAIVGQELYDRIAPMIGETSLSHVVVAAYSDYLNEKSYQFNLPDVVMQTELKIDSVQNRAVTRWSEAINAGICPSKSSTTGDDIALLPYTSGTTGLPKGCIHTHKTVQANIVGAALWSSITQGAVALATLPFFHVTGMQHSMNAPIYMGSTMVVMTRWDRDTAAKLIESSRCTHWTNIATMVIDFLANPKLMDYDISSLKAIAGGGAALPEAVGEKLFAFTGVRYVEGYGLSETISQTHFNPLDRPKLQCMGIPSFDVDARIIDPETVQELGPNEEGEVIVRGPQVFQEYWNRDDENRKAFIEFDGKRYFRTGDIAKYDEEGYFFMVDRVKRMINASGYKVWPTEVESILYKHPVVKQVCVIGVPDERRGETVKAFIVPKEQIDVNVTEQEIIDWAKDHMAAYKYPRTIEFVSGLPMSGSGKVLWRKLREDEMEKLHR